MSRGSAGSERGDGEQVRESRGCREVHGPAWGWGREKVRGFGKIDPAVLAGAAGAPFWTGSGEDLGARMGGRGTGDTAGEAGGGPAAWLGCHRRGLEQQIFVLSPCQRPEA